MPKPSLKLADYDTRDPLAIAAWAWEKLCVENARIDASADADDAVSIAHACGGCEVLESLIEGILGTTYPVEIRNHLAKLPGYSPDGQYRG